MEEGDTNPLQQLAAAVRQTEYEITGERAEWSERVGAKVIDYGIVGIPAVAAILMDAGIQHDTYEALVPGLALAALFLYSLLNLTIRGSLGKRIYGIELMMPDSSPPSRTRRLMRWIIQHGFFYSACGLAVLLADLDHGAYGPVEELAGRAMVILMIAAWVFYVAQIMTMLLSGLCIHDHLTGIIVGTVGERPRSGQPGAFLVIQK
jgi:hypothetical protein